MRVTGQNFLAQYCGTIEKIELSREHRMGLFSDWVTLEAGLLIINSIRVHRHVQDPLVCYTFTIIPI